MSRFSSSQLLVALCGSACAGETKLCRQSTARSAEQQACGRQGATEQESAQRQQRRTEEESLQRIYEHAHAEVRKRLRVSGEEEEEVQEAVARLLAWLKRRGKDLLALPEADLRRMLKCIVGRRVADLRRRGRRGNACELPEELASGGPTPELAASKAELLALVRRAIDSLPQCMRAVIVDRFIEDRPYAEIAADLDISKNYCRQLCHRGLQRLRQKLRQLL